MRWSLLAKSASRKLSAGSGPADKPKRAARLAAGVQGVGPGLTSPNAIPQLRLAKISNSTRKRASAAEELKLIDELQFR
jgi:hypothetical protein